MEDGKTLQFGLVPASVVQGLNAHGDWKARANAIEAMEDAVMGLNDGNALLPSLPAFLEFLCSLMRDTNFKISLVATNIMGFVVGLLGSSSIRPHAGAICDSLIDRLSDPKIIVRQANMKVISKLMACLRPRFVIDRFLSALAASSSSSRTKEEIINAVIMALLTYGKDEQLAFPPIVRALLEAIKNEAGRVRAVAVEAMAVINNLLGSHLGGLLSSIGPSAQTRQLLETRFKARALPKIGSDGLVDHCAQVGMGQMRLSDGGSSSPAVRLDNDSDDDEQPQSPVRRCRSNNILKWDVASPSSRSGRRTRGGIEYNSMQGDGTGSLMMRRMQKQPPAVEVVTPAGDEDLMSARSDAGPRAGSPTMASHDTMPLSAGAFAPQGGSFPRTPVGSGAGAASGPHTPLRSVTGLRPHHNGAAEYGHQAHPPGEGANLFSDEALARRGYSDSAPQGLRAGRRRTSNTSDQAPDSPSGLRGNPLTRIPSDPRDHYASTPTAHQRAISNPLDYGLVNTNGSPSKPALVSSPQRVENSTWAPSLELPSPGLRDERHATWSPAGSIAPDTPSTVSSKLAILKRRNQESRRGSTQSPACSLVESDSPMGRRPPLGPSGPADPDWRFQSSPDGRYSPLSASSPTHQASPVHRETPLRTAASASSSLGPGRSNRGMGRPGRSPSNGTLSPTVKVPSPDYDDDDAEVGAARRAATAIDRARGGGAGAVEELETEDLQPMPNPSSALTKVIAGLVKANKANRKELDWIAQYEAITNARRLVVHHREVFSGNIHAFAQAALPAVDGLRSLTAKNALMLWQEVFQSLGRQMDPEVEHICPVLAKRAGDVSQAGRETFLAGAAAKALQEMVMNCSEARSTAALCACVGHSSKYVRAKVASTIDSLLRNSSMPPSFSSTERCFNAATSFLEDAGAEARTSAKRILWAIYDRSPSDFRDLTRRIPNEAKANKVRDVVEKGSEPPPPIRTMASFGSRSRGPTPGSSPAARSSSSSTPTSARSTPTHGGFGATSPQSPDMTLSGISRTNSDLRSRGRSPSRPSRSRLGSSRGDSSGVSGEVEAALATVTRKLESKNWSERCEALQSLARLRDDLPALPPKDISRVLDMLKDRLGDGNLKVNLVALDTLEGILPRLGNLAGPAVNTLVPALSTNLASTNGPIRSKASGAIDSLIRSVDGAQLVQHLSHVISHSNQRSKAVMIEKLEVVVRESYAQQPRLVGKNALGAALSSLNDSKADIRAANNKLLQTLYAAMGPQLLEVGLSDDVCQRIAAIVR